MERLESAMVKARAARAKALAADGQSIDTPPVTEKSANASLSGPAAEAAPPRTASGDWAILRSIEITPRRANRNRLAAVLGKERSTPYDILRSRVVRQMQENSWRRLAVTSPNVKCGKSTVSLNLALSLARFGQFKVILFDFDLRRPSLVNLLHQKTAPNIAGLLQPGADLTDYAVRFGTNLAICTNRAPVPNSAEILHSTSTREALDRIQAEWQPDVMIFDTPPMQGNDDNLGFFAQIDCALLVAAAGSTTLAEIDRCEQDVSKLTNVVGTVLNKCRYIDRASGDHEAYY